MKERCKDEPDPSLCMTGTMLLMLLDQGSTTPSGQREDLLERLLNIKQAAEFLNVSEITVRRWTNQGSLNCYRVGKRRARRFRPQDLMACLEGLPAAAASGRVALGIMDLTVPDGSHIAHLSSERSESLKVAAAFILEGLQTGETVCIVAAEDQAGPLMNVLEERTPRLERFSAAGKLHLSQGLGSLERQTQYLQVLAAQSDGRFRVFCDMSWTYKKGWPTQDLARLEKTISTLRQARGCLFLCQYALDRFRGGEIMTALETHTHSIYRGRVIENPYGGHLVTAGATVL
ncbi:MAG: MEDS domain-containing protein [Desulfosarcina sp.]